MTIELKKRVKTSSILLLLAFFCIFSNDIVFFISLILITGLAFFEISEIIKKICKSVKSIKYFILNILALYYGLIIFIIPSIILRDSNTILNSSINAGPMCILFVLLICIFTDIGGYFVGKKIGGKKLSNISPSKTISGSIGSFIFSIIPLLIFSFIYSEEYLINVKNISLCLLVSLISQMGDLFISFTKRKANVKDTGRILPGHGGILDRIDGIIFALPFAWLILYYGFI
tara:strand:- start:105 stop:797 length:693 start_codon:yes stop_codon:yes gene_type:complete